MKTFYYLLLVVGVNLLATDSFSQTGCTNPESCNFDASAVTDDGSCILSYTDLDCNRVTDIFDYLIMMDHLGCVIEPGVTDDETTSCDFDQNLVVGVSDIIIMISAYGEFEQ
jgi:hypothetical protein